ncbi:hypothetical protein [Algoriphagus sp. A40]|uniref:hypothetical protein n=1 Tax=Algoriphagus sp. A40 TaxID=1945863 RepID=UPI000987BDBF|nr:hypothetical protein [Algoriphagus sp. A40]OOG71896.1 hypothetical protein B0E43_16570 [Algoriphagus sp. A40]
MNFKALILACFCLFLHFHSFGQESALKNAELENFLLITDQDAYLSGDRVWFAAKLLKNHETYRYSKLAYIAVLDGSGKPIHQEKMLLTGQDMVYGDLFIPETSQSGVFSIVVYSKWMSNFQDFPIAKKEFLVANPNSPKPEGEPALFWEQIPFENAPVSFYHTSDRPEVVEIQDKSGKTLEVMEAVAPMQKTLSKVKLSEGYRLLFRNTEYSIEPEKWYWDPAEFSLSSNLGQRDYRVVTHSDWDILEEVRVNGPKTLLKKDLYQNLNSFQISVVKGSGELIWSYQVQLAARNSGQMQISSKGKTGEELQLDLFGFTAQFDNGIVLASEEEDAQITDFVEILNHPNWKNLSGGNKESNLISALGKEVESPLLLKDYSPMFDYKVWSTDIHSRFKSSVQPSDFTFTVSEQVLEQLINRKVYRDHFEISEEVVELQSPFTADRVYYLQDYGEFPDLESLIKEIVPQVRLKKTSNGTGKVIFIANTDNENVKFNKKPLILVDFYRPLSLEEVWKLDILSLDRIELYYHRSTVESTNLGESVGDGLIVFYTKNNEYFLKNNLPKERYFLSDVSVPRRPDYSGTNSKVISANPLQFLESGLTFNRGRSKSGNLLFDTAGNWLVEAWLFGNSEFERIQKRVEIDP